MWWVNVLRTTVNACVDTWEIPEHAGNRSGRCMAAGQHGGSGRVLAGPDRPRRHTQDPSRGLRWSSDRSSPWGHREVARLRQPVALRVRIDHNNLRYLTRVNKGKVFRWALALSDYDFTIEFISDESDNIADWLSRYAGDDEGDDALLDRISLKVAAVWAPRLLNLPALPTKEVFVKAYVQKGNPNLPGLHCNDRWWIRQRQKRSTSPASYAHGWPSYSTSVRTAAWELARRAGGPRTSKMIRERLICARLKTPPVHQQGLPSGGI